MYQNKPAKKYHYIEETSDITLNNDANRWVDGRFSPLKVNTDSVVFLEI